MSLAGFTAKGPVFAGFPDRVCTVFFVTATDSIVWKSDSHVFLIVFVTQASLSLGDAVVWFFRDEVLRNVLVPAPWRVAAVEEGASVAAPVVDAGEFVVVARWAVNRRGTIGVWFDGCEGVSTALDALVEGHHMPIKPLR